MKFATLKLTLAGALLAAIPGTSLGGGPRGLLDSHCGCATQKGVTQKGHFAQKATCGHKGCAPSGCAQKGHIVQKGHFAQKATCGHKGCAPTGCAQKGHVAQKGCSTKGGCGSCSICLPRVLPAVLHGIDNLLNKLFCCSSCGVSKGCGCGAPMIARKGSIQKGPLQKGIAQKGSSCGCGSSHGAGSVPPPNPFVDDELQAPPAPDAEARRQRLWNLPKQVSNRAGITTTSRARTTTASRSIVKTASAKSEPRTLSVRVAQPISKKREVKTVTRPAPVVKTSSQTSAGLPIPQNPLRGA